MKKIIVFSDVHFDAFKLKKLEQIFSESDYIFFLGDGLNSVQKYKNLYGDKFIAVKGNCDTMAEDLEKVVQVEDVKFLLTHGHEYNVKSDLLNLEMRARELGVDCAIFGHTHMATNQKLENLMLINPGSLSMPRLLEPSYSYIIVVGKKFFEKNVKIL